MTSILWPSNTEEIIDNIRGAIGRVVYFNHPTLTTCTGCVLDPVTNTSINSFCPICSGQYYIKNYTQSGIMAHVTWGPSDIMNWSTGGQYFEGDCRIQIKYSAEHVSLLDNTDFIYIDTKKFDIRKVTYRGVPQLNRILIDCIELDKD